MLTTTVLLTALAAASSAFAAKSSPPTYSQHLMPWEIQKFDYFVPYNHTKYRSTFLFQLHDPNIMDAGVTVDSQTQGLIPTTKRATTWVYNKTQNYIPLPEWETHVWIDMAATVHEAPTDAFNGGRLDFIPDQTPGTVMRLMLDSEWPYGYPSVDMDGQKEVAAYNQHTLGNFTAIEGKTVDKKCTAKGCEYTLCKGPIKIQPVWSVQQRSFDDGPNP